MKKKKLGILGGTFDPVHNGHIYSAQAVFEHMGLEKVLFIPAYIAPHKIGQECAPAADRFAMTELAVKDYPYFEVSDIELKRNNISYTFDTITELEQMFPEYELYFIIGADTIPQLHTWHRIRELLEKVTFVAAVRPGYTQAIGDVCRQLGCISREKIILLDTPEYEVSSTAIRQRIKAHVPLTELVPDSVEKYIQEHKLYFYSNEG